MKLRAPAYPLITIDPYFNIWSMADKLPGEDTLHWTGKPHRLTGILTVDGKEYAFMGKASCALMEQRSVDVSALTTTYVFTCDEGTLTVDFTTPMLPGDLMLLSRPISYVAFAWTGKPAAVTLTADEELCLDTKGESPVAGTVLALEGLTAVSDRLPEGVELNSWNFRREEGVKFAGESDDASGVYTLKDRLLDTKVFAEVILTGPSAGKGGKQRFDIDCRYATEDQ